MHGHGLARTSLRYVWLFNSMRPSHLEYWNFKRARLDEIRSQFEDRWDTKDKLESKEVKLDVNNTKLDVKERRPDSTFDSATFIRNQRQFNKRIIKFTSELLDNAFSICGMQSNMSPLILICRGCSGGVLCVCIGIT